jgi:hypothetical protein
VPDALTCKTDALSAAVLLRKQRSDLLQHRHLSFVDATEGNELLSDACVRLLRANGVNDSTADNTAYEFDVEAALAACNNTREAVR